MFDEKGGKKFFSTPRINIDPFVKPLMYLIITALLIVLLYYTIMAINPSKNCIDDTLSGDCSTIKPFYCANGKLIRRASVCGCSEIAFGEDEYCISKYQNQSKEINLKYILRGEEGEINYIVYGGLVDYLSGLSRSISYEDGEIPVRRDFKIKKIYDEEQRELILSLILKIKEITSDKEDQFRIAVSLVQKIDFGFSNKTDIEFGHEIYHQRYPYEVLYEQQGICGEKSELLVLLLKELGYETVIFYHQEENHESVGVKCPEEYSHQNTGYCFIETTGHSIITNDQINYIGGTILKSEPEIMLISNGESFGDNLYEYKDAQTIINLENKINTKGRLNLFEIYQFKKLKEKYNLADYYDPR
ncbi:MAG: hypothetical protein ABFQ65_02000 [Nanoarchaeota archaeon]